MNCRVLGVCAAVLASSMGYAQQAGAPATSTLTVNSRLVVLDVVVLDAHGDAVTTLGREQFRVSEDGVPQTIRTFDPPSRHAMPAGGEALVHSAADLSRIGTAPVDILVLDEVNTGFMQMAFARQMLEKYVRRQPAVLPVPTLFVAAGAKRLAVLHDYTQSRDEVLESIRKHTTDVDFNSLVVALNGGGGGATNGMEKTLGALLQVTNSVRGIPGRKNLIWVGNGYGNADDAANLLDSDRDRVEKMQRTITNRMLAARVTLYTIDPSGNKARDDGAGAVAGNENSGLPGQTDNNVTDASAGPAGSLDGFARATGGRVLFNRNDIDAQIAAVAHESASFYTLGYVPAGALVGDEKYRRISVTLSDPTLHAVYRTGYFGGLDEPAEALAPNTQKHQPKELLFDLTSAARTTLAYTALHTTAERTARGYNVLVAAPDLHFRSDADGERRAEVTVLAVCFNAHGHEVGQHAAELTDALNARDRIDQPGARVGFSFPMTVPPGTTRVRIIVRDAVSGDLGSVDAKP